MNRRFRLLLAVLLLAGAAGCCWQAAAGRQGPGGETCLRMAGSTSMEKMTNVLAEVFMEKYPGITVTVEFTGSSAGAEAVVNDTADIANMSRDMGREEAAEGLAENIVALDGIVVCVDKSNEITGLTRRQLRDIYTGRITNWTDVGGRDLPIVTVGREAGSGTREAFETFLGLKDRCEYANVMDSSGAVAARLARTPGAIGYLSLDTAGEAVRILSLEGVMPCAENIGSGEYPLSRACVMATKGEISEQSALVQAWFAFVYSREGQELIEGAGLVPRQIPGSGRRQVR